MRAKYPDQKVFFASWNKARDIRRLSEMIVGGWLLRGSSRASVAHSTAAELARKHPYRPELNVLVVGMPNVGKSTLLNSLRNMGIPGSERPSSLQF